MRSRGAKHTENGGGGADESGGHRAGRPDGDVGEQDGAKRGRSARVVAGHRAVVAAAMLLTLTAALFPGTARHRQQSTNGVKPSASGANVAGHLSALRPAAAPPRKEWSQCAVPPKSTIAVEKKVEPLWLPTYPTSLPEQGYADFLAALTGVPNAARSYYRSSPTLKRCHNRGGSSADKVQGITCDIVHPIVPCKRPHPSAQAAGFGRGVLVALRNPLTAFPAWQQSKAEAYHGQVGQVNKKAWEEFRDKFVGTAELGTVFPEWRNFIMEWRSMTPYHVVGYLPWESWADADAGPALAATVAQALREAGLPVRYDNTSDVGCLWQAHLSKAVAAEQEKHATHGWYEPKYTPEQLRMIASALDDFAAEVKGALDGDGARPGDRELHEILRGYADGAREALRTQEGRRG